jgi:hypothetical protein
MEQDFRAEVRYGMGAVCEADLEEVEGLTACELIQKVVSTPQQSQSAQRTARVLKEVIGSKRTLDVEIISGHGDDGETGEPVELNDVLIRKSEENTKTDAINIRVSEPYVGG